MHASYMSIVINLTLHGIILRKENILLTTISAPKYAWICMVVCIYFVTPLNLTAESKQADTVKSRNVNFSSTLELWF